MSCCCDGPGKSSPPPEVRTEEDLVAWVEASRGAEGRVDHLLSLLRESHPVYDGRGTAAVVRMRGWLLVALGEEELAGEALTDEALPFLVEELESGHDAYLTAAAAAALRRCAPRQEWVAPLLAALLYIRYRDDSVTLQTYGGYGVPGERTTAVFEVLKTLEALGPEGREALPRLRELEREVSPATPWFDALKRTLRSLAEDPGASKSCCGGRLREPSSPPKNGLRVEPRDLATPVDLELEDQDGVALRIGDFFSPQRRQIDLDLGAFSDLGDWADIAFRLFDDAVDG